MLRIPATFVTVAGTAFLVASYANPASRTGAALIAPPALEVASAKGDLLKAPRRLSEPTPVSLVEVVGVGHPAVTLRDRDGVVVYRSDPASSTTVVSKGAVIPAVTLKGEPSGPVVARIPVPQQPTRAQEGGEVPAAAQRRKRPVGCEAAVSPLARGHADQAPIRCFAQASSVGSLL